MPETGNDEAQKGLDREEVIKLPYNIRLDLARTNVTGAIASTQRVCDIDDATMALLLDAEAGRLRSGLCQAAAAQYAMAPKPTGEWRTRMVPVDGGKASKVTPAKEPAEKTA